MGVPLRSMPRLMQLSTDLQQGNPAELMVAMQVDARMVLPGSATPTLNLKLQPATPGTFEGFDKKLSLQWVTSNVATQGLDAPPKGQRWLFYSLPLASQQQVLRVRNFIITTKEKCKCKGTLGVGIGYDTLIATDPTLAHTRWETWVQTRQRDGFQVWSGTPAEPLKLAQSNR